MGEPRLHPTAGATVVGARKFLIAYNINLNTPDIEIAKRIAKNIRFSNGGLRYVKAMGVDLRARNLAQVSINLTDFEQTPLHRVFEMVKREAERYGVTIVGSEIVGTHSEARHRADRRLLSAARKLFSRASVGESSGGFSRRRALRRTWQARRHGPAVPRRCSRANGGSRRRFGCRPRRRVGRQLWDKWSPGSHARKNHKQHYVEPLSESLVRIQAQLLERSRKQSIATPHRLNP